MTKILIADDHPVIRSGLKHIIQSNIANTAIDESHNGISALDKVKGVVYDLVILDVRMPGTDPVKLVNDILLVAPGARLLMLSMNNEELYAKKFLQIGAMGYINKGASEQEIISAIGNLLNNKKYLSPALLENLAQEAFSKAPANPFDKLSNREVEILQHMLVGERVSDISEKLDLNMSTVGTYKARIYQKLNCNKLTDISSLAGIYNFPVP